MCAVFRRYTKNNAKVCEDGRVLFFFFFHIIQKKKPVPISLTDWIFFVGHNLKNALSIYVYRRIALKNRQKVEVLFNTYEQMKSRFYNDFCFSLHFFIMVFQFSFFILIVYKKGFSR